MTSANRAKLESGREAIHSLRAHAEKVAERGVAATSAAADAAERASRRAAHVISAQTKHLSRSAKNFAPRGHQGLMAMPVVRGAARLARRHPALLIVAGLAAAVGGYAALRARSQAKETAPSDETY